MNVSEQVKNLFHYIRTPHRWRTWPNPLILLVVCAFAIFLAFLFGMPSYSAQGAAGLTSKQAVTQAPVATPEATRPAPVQATNTSTPLPAEFIANGQQTIGITFAGAILVLIVVIGVIVFLPKNTE